MVAIADLGEDDVADFADTGRVFEKFDEVGFLEAQALAII